MLTDCDIFYVLMLSVKQKGGVRFQISNRRIPTLRLVLYILSLSGQTDILTERSNSPAGHFEMLSAKRDAYYCYAEQCPEKQMRDANRQAADEEPDDIHTNAETSTAAFCLHNIGSKGP